MLLSKKEVVADVFTKKAVDNLKKIYLEN